MEEEGASVEVLCISKDEPLETTIETETVHTDNHVVHQTVHTENHIVHHDVDKTLRDAEEFLANFAGLRGENEQLKQTNQDLELQLEKSRLDLRELSLEKDQLENQILQEREQNKEVVWKLRSDFQKVQDERLMWKEKYLDSCINLPSMRNNNSQGNGGGGRSSSSGLMHDYSSSLSSSSFGFHDQAMQAEEVILTLISEDSKSYKISIRECNFCGIGFCSALGLSEHARVCSKRPFRVDGEIDGICKSSSRDEIVGSLDCEVCNVKFPTHADLVQHNQFHQGTHKFLCRICNRSYQSNPGRLKHEQFEHGSLPLLQCEACGKQFKRKDRLKDHIATKHSVATPHRCPYCDSAFKLRDYLRKHVNQYHPGKTLATLTGLPLKSELKTDFSIKSDGEVTVTTDNNNHDMQLDLRLGDVVDASKFADNNGHQLGKSLTLTSFSIKNGDHHHHHHHGGDHVVTSSEYNHIVNNTLTLTDVRQVEVTQISDSEMTDSEETHIVIDTGE